MSIAATKQSKRDYTQGPLFTRLFLFAVPLMVSGLLQVFYNIADKIVVGRYSSDPNALAAVGCTTIVSGCLVNFALGFSAGAGVIVAQHFGAKNDKKLSKSIHTSIAIALVAGILISAIGILSSRGILELMNTKPELIDSGTLYLKIIFLGSPASILYNFGASVLRSIGDSKSSLYILSISGILNVALNFLFVLGFDKNGKLILVDYKTDSFYGVPEAEAEATLRERHSRQIGYYKYACRELFGVPCERAYIYSFALNKTIEI